MRWKNKFDPRNAACMPVVKYIFRLELEQIYIPLCVSIVVHSV